MLQQQMFNLTKDQLTMKKTLSENLTDLAELKLLSKLSPVTESEAGKNLARALQDSADDTVVKWTDLPPVPPGQLVDVTAELLLPSAHTALEDRCINGPVFRALSNNMKGGKLALTVSRSRLIDGAGREQWSDMTLFSGLQEWPQAVTLLDGKPTVGDVLLGQGMRRALALLSMQPWRAFVVMPLYSLEQVRFLRVEQHPTRVAVSDLLDMFVYTYPRNSKGKPMPRFFQQAGGGFSQLLHFLNNPALLGYIPCPVRLTALDTFEQDSFRACTICAPSNGRAVFLVNDSTVCKAFADGSAAEAELAWRSQADCPKASAVRCDGEG